MGHTPIWRRVRLLMGQAPFVTGTLSPGLSGVTVGPDRLDRAPPRAGQQQQEQSRTGCQSRAVPPNEQSTSHD